MIMKTITRDTQVGIYDNCQQVARVYADRTVATLPYVKWVGNSGGYAERKIRIDGAAHDDIVTALEDGAEDSAWDIISEVEGGNYRPNPVGRPSELTDGKRVNVYLDPASLAAAAKIGNGNVSEGIRVALASHATA